MSITYTPVGHDEFRCTLATRDGRSLNVAGTVEHGTAEDSGDESLRANRSLVMMLSAYAHNEALYRRLRASEKRRSHRRAADEYRKDVGTLTTMVERLDLESKARQEWCSCCFAWSLHQPVSGMARPRPTYLCHGCGAPTTTCPAPACGHMASRGFGRASTGRFCAEHRHEIPSFERLDMHLDQLEDYADWLEFENLNLTRLAKITSVGVLSAAMLSPAAFAAAPAIGGAAGSLTGLSGAAAASHGLAMVGGGSLAAGGLGMAGGTAVITAVGASLGGAVGATVTSAYVRADPSFEIAKLQDGTGAPVLFASGFTTQKQTGWGSWRDLILGRYPDRPVYRVRWGSKEIKNLVTWVGRGGGQQVVKAGLKGLAAKAGKVAASKLGPLGPLLLATDLAKNPWTVARTRAGMTGAILADILARTGDGQFVLIGHSLGGRVMVTAAQELGTLPGGTQRLEDVHLLGTAVSLGGDWRTLSHAVEGRVYNYWSTNDDVLRHLYRWGELGAQAVGHKGFTSKFANIVDRNVTRQVGGHTEYVGNVTLCA